VRRRIGRFLKIHSFYRAFRYMEIRYKENRLIWKTVGEKKSGPDAFIRYMEIRNTESRL